MESVYIISRDGKRIGITRASEAIGPLEWFHHNCPAYSSAHAVQHEGYSVEEEEPDCGDVAELLEGIAERIGLSAEFEFVPFSRSRNADPANGFNGKPWRSLNWRVTLKRGATVILVTDYGQGEAYAPAYKRTSGIKGSADKWAQQKAIEGETETGTVWLFGTSLSSAGPRDTRRPIAPPRLGDVLQSLALDSRVLDEGPFEEWASSLGYDPDSRKAEGIWKACVETATALRGALGGRKVEELQLAAEFN